MTAPLERLATLLRRTCGIVVNEDKPFLVETRLLPIARRLGLDSVSALVERVDASRDPALIQDVVDAMTTNETFFFRDRTPFDMFRDVMLPYLLETREAQRQIRIWCTACSTGQEPYSLAMALDEKAARLAGWRIDILATDISSAVIRTAREGLYNQFEVQRGLPVSSLLRYFSREGDRWRIAEHLRSRVHFAEFNLLRDFSEHGVFDVVFCRNVLLYFDQPTKADILKRLAASTRPDGFLMLGSTELPNGAGQQWVASQGNPSLFVRTNGPHAPENKLRLVAAS
jgi:chemotaxis protein methyltransferase CheR